ncbi:hypothetical protein [Actinomadura rubrisoli]|uniref:Terpene synthase n=1 Tax=Actinomadura rubrisoli TaxID=2530368 RepID=A0A4R5BD86_9ACTN|nr:hypothetical protein [Actinomadura rubrisoli]TDD84478.1 hypothetical protein E1298_19870 [Actinomadura rubrisoli]
MNLTAERYIELLVDFLDKVGYSEQGDPDEDLVQTLGHVFTETIDHFRYESRVRGIEIDRERLTSTVRTITRMTVFGWRNLPREVMVPLSTYFTYVILEDDPGDGSTLVHTPFMDSFACDFLRGREQAHPRYRSLFSFFPDLLRCYGQHSQLTMLKSNLELILGFWIEGRKFKGSPGAGAYPMFLRRLNGLGDFSGAALFPASQFDEREQYEDIVIVIAQIEPVVALVNDLFSFYKEIHDPAGDVSLVENICITDELDAEQAIHRIANDAASAIRDLIGVLESRRSEVILNTVNDFVQGYIRWHLCDERYRMRELIAQCGNGNSATARFRTLHEMASRAGCVDRVDFHALSRATSEAAFDKSRTAV